MKLSATAVIGAIAVIATTSVFVLVRWRGSQTVIDAGFWYDDGSLGLSEDDTTKIGGPLTPQELATIKQISRAEIVRAFADLRINLTDSQHAFWRVAVVGTPRRDMNFRKYPFAAAGESHVFGPLGGWGSVGFLILAHNAIEYAPPSASRQEIVAGIGRGIGRAAVHEFAHQALGVDNKANIDNRDPASYEHRNADRPSQYYGELRWSTAWPVLQQKFGR